MEEGAGMLNPYLYKPDGDLSRADVVALTLLTRGKDVVEFGVGASTQIFDKVAKSVKSYDTDWDWIERTQAKTINVKYELIEKIPTAVKGEPCDVLFDDGHSLLRTPFLLEYWPYVKDCVILHDGRMTYAANCVKRFLDCWESNGQDKNPDNHYLGSLESIHWNWLESNMVVLKKRNCTLTYENWNVTEKD